MGSDKTKRLLRTMKQSVPVVTPIATNMVLPNHSGGKRDPVLEQDIATKKYVDDNVVAGGGDVTKVGTPVNNELGVWTGDGTIEGDTNLTWDASTLTVAGGVSVAIPDNTAEAFKIAEGANGYFCCTSTNGSEEIKLGCVGTTILTLNTSGATFGVPVDTGTNALTVNSVEVVGSDGEVNAAAIEDKFLKNDAADAGVGLTLTGDNSSADTAYVPMVLYNTDATPPAANTVPIGTIYIQYTA